MKAVITASQEVRRSLPSGWVAPIIYRIMASKTLDREGEVEVVWTPADNSKAMIKAMTA